MNFSRRKATVALALILVLASVFGVCAAAATNADYDASVRGASGNVNLSTTDILEEYLNEELSASECEFFDTVKALGAFETVELSYNEIINTNKASLTYEGGALVIKALKYEYVGAGNKEFSWIPVSAEYGDKTVNLVKNGVEYVGNIECAEPENDADVKVKYCAEVQISEADMAEIVNLYRNSAEYAAKRAEYDAYVIEKKMYDDAKAKYDKYLLDVEEYEDLLYAFNNYDETLQKYNDDVVKYQEYETAKKEYDAKLSEYNAYMQEYSKVLKQLDAVKLIDVKMTSLQRTVYSAVMGGTVDQVLENESAIIAAGADKDAVKLAGVATERVRSLMKGFKACKTDADKYRYYTQNYDNLCESFLLLTQTLDALYTRAVRAFLVANDKNEKYVILVAQLALITNALIDGDVRDYWGKISYTPSWKIDGKTIKQILDNKNYFVDDDTAAPITPPAEVEKPADLVEVKKPVFPLPPADPLEPTPVSNPGSAPKSVKNPDKTLKQAELPAIYSALGAEYRSVLKAVYENNTIPEKREAHSFNMSLSTEMVKSYKTEIVEIKFELPDGSVSTISVDKSSPVVCEIKVPESYVDEFGDTRVFVGWGVKTLSRAASSFSQTVDLNLGFAENTLLQPLYEKYCNVTWEINGTEYKKLVSVLENPVCSVLPKKADEGNKCYEFVGWVSEDGENVGADIPKPESDVKYTALFEEKYIVECQAGGLSQFGADITYEDSNVICDAASASADARIYISKIVDRAAEKQSSLTINAKRGTLKFTFSDVLLLKSKGAASVKLAHSGSKLIDKYKITICDENGNPISQSFEFTSKTSSDDVSKYKLYKCPEGEARSYVRYSSSEKSVTFEAESGVQYLFKAEYAVRWFGATELVDFEVSNASPERNELVNYRVTPKEGVEILEIIVEDDLGNAVVLYDDEQRPIKLDGSVLLDNAMFQVLTNDVNIMINARYKTYSVVCIANGKIIYQTKVSHNAELTLPKPTMGDDGIYSYKFVGWDFDGDGVPDEIKTALSDIECVAVYEKTLIPVKEDTGGLKLSPKVKKLFYLAIIAFVLFIIAVVAVTLLIVKKLHKRKALRLGFESYAEYKAKKRLDALNTKREELEAIVGEKNEESTKSYKKLTKVNIKLINANAKFEKAIEKRVKSTKKQKTKKTKKTESEGE